MMLNVFFCSLFNMLKRLQLHGAFAAGRSEELGETSKCEGRSDQVAVVLAGWTFGKLMNILTIVLFKVLCKGEVFVQQLHSMMPQARAIMIIGVLPNWMLSRTCHPQYSGDTMLFQNGNQGGSAGAP